MAKNENVKSLPKDFSKADLRMNLQRDIQCAISLLTLCLNEDSIFDKLHKILEDHRQVMLKRQSEGAKLETEKTPV